MASVIAEIEECIPTLRRYASALLRDRQEVDDLVHDCLVRALDRLHTRRDDGDLRAWLFAIMHNLFISRIRWIKRRGVTESLDTADPAALGQRASQEDPLRQLDLMRALDELPEDQRSVLLLVAVEDLPYAETARLLGVPIGTVMSRLSRAREKLRRSMGEEAPPALRRVK
jgi:RNA polymerase sigma-70 factor (ECF subfamily)